MSDEEDAEIAYKTAAMLTSLYSCHINDKQNIQEFAKRQTKLFEYSQNKFIYKEGELPNSYKDRSKQEEDIMNDPNTQRLIKNFKYMKENGIFDAIRNYKD